MTPVTRLGPTCTVDGCNRPLSHEGLCRPCSRLWKLTAGAPHPGVQPAQRYEIEQDGVLFHVIDSRTGDPAKLGNLICLNLDFDAAADALMELRLDEELAA